MAALQAPRTIPQLPNELSLQIMKHVMGDERQNSNIIEVRIDRKPKISHVPLAPPWGPEKEDRRPWRADYSYRVQGWNPPSPLLSVNHAMRAEYIQQVPDYLQLNRGPLVRFNAARDTI